MADIMSRYRHSAFGNSRRVRVDYSGRMIVKSVEKFTLSFFGSGGDPKAEVGGNHVHKAEPHNGHVSVDNYLHVHTIDR